MAIYDAATSLRFEHTIYHLIDSDIFFGIVFLDKTYRAQRPLGDNGVIGCDLTIHGSVSMTFVEAVMDRYPGTTRARNNGGVWKLENPAFLSDVLRLGP